MFLFICFILAFFIALCVNKFFLRNNFTFFIKKQNIASKRFATQPKPIFGGIAFFTVFVFIIIIMLFTNKLYMHLPAEFIALLLIGIIAFSMGIADDILQTRPHVKILMQMVCCIILLFSDIYIQVSPYMFLNWVITFFWVVGIMNSINMLDNMDTVSTMVTLSIFCGIIFYTLIFGSVLLEFEIFILVALSAALLCFLFFNWHPAKMYMGDNGSQFLGVILAYFGIRFFSASIDIVKYSFGVNTIQLIIVILAFIIPISDTTTVVINRLLKKTSPFKGDKNHTTHHLFYLGIPIRYIGIILFVVNLIGVFLSLFLIHNFYLIKTSQYFLFLIYPITVFLLLYINTKLSKEKNI